MAIRAHLAWILAAPALVLVLTGRAESAEPSPADVLFVGDHIVTMEPGPAVSALAIRGEDIVWTGGREQAAAWTGPETRVHELGERALLPGFIDAHGHLTYQAAIIDLANVASPPVGPVEDMASLGVVLRAYMAQRDIAPGAWVVGNGYDDSLLAERRHPTREDLDAISTRHPIALVHVSGHLATANSLALAQIGYHAETADPPGGHIRRRPDSREPSGVLEETAIAPLRALLGTQGADPRDNIRKALQLYASHGITTVQDGATGAPGLELLQAVAAAGQLSLDVIAYPVLADPEAPLPGQDQLGVYRNRLKLGGIKLVLDGSPQGKTAYLTRPYAVPPSGQGADYRGYPIFQQPVLETLVARPLAAGVPVLAHANGDAAADMLIDAVAASGEADRDHRLVMIHAQTVREDQLQRMLELGVIPSFYSAHTFYWGDWHRDSVLGPERAARISPTRSARDLGLHFTVHNDSPVVPPDMIRLLWATTNRVTRSGQVLGADQRILVRDALAAVTRDAAYQSFDEAIKGSLAPGKLADLVVLSADPLDTRPQDLLELEVLETWSRGQRVYAAD